MSFEVRVRADVIPPGKASTTSYNAEEKNTLSPIQSNIRYTKACCFSLLYGLFGLAEVGLH